MRSVHVAIVVLVIASCVALLVCATCLAVYSSKKCKVEKAHCQLAQQPTAAAVTFIIPSINRDTLNRTLRSLIRQSDTHWTAIVAFDGIEPSTDHLISDPRIKFLFLKQKQGVDTERWAGRAGSVRNYAIQHSTTAADWLAFVDDDDTVHMDYVKLLRENIALRPTSDVFIFTMKWESGRLIPRVGTTQFRRGDVGISFALKRDLFSKGFEFRNSETEDFDLLDALRSASMEITLLPDIMYFVEHDSETAPPTRPRLIPPVQRKIYCYWGGGKMSSTRQKCFQAMSQLGLPLHLITDESIPSLVAATGRPLHPAYRHLTATHKSDYLRSYLMHFLGGGYADIKMPSKSWVPAFRDLDDAGAHIYGNGSAETRPKDLGYWEALTASEKQTVAKKYNQFLSNGNFVFRPRTPFTEAWYAAVQKLMDKHMDALAKRKSTGFPRRYLEIGDDKNDVSLKAQADGYPLRYVEVQGEVFHRIMNDFLGHFLYTLPPLQFSMPYR